MTVDVIKDGTQTRITPQNYVKPHYELTSEELEKKLKNLSILKRAAFDEGKLCRVIRPRSIPESFGKGHTAEIAISGMLGRLESFYKERYDIEFKPSFNFISDINKKTDMVICGRGVDIKSQYLIQKTDPRFSIILPSDALVFYDKPGIYNMCVVLATIDLLRPVDDDTLISDLNYIWELYMVLKIKRDVFITHKDYSDKDLDRYTLYLDDFPGLSSSINHLIETPSQISKEDNVNENTDLNSGAPIIKKHQRITKPEFIEVIKTTLAELNITEQNILLMDGFKIIENEIKTKHTSTVSKLYGHKLNATKVLLDIFPNLSKQIAFFEYKKGKFELSKKLVAKKLADTYKTKDELCQTITKDIANSLFFEYFIESYYDNSLYSFVTSIFPDIKIWDILNIESFEYKTGNHLQQMIDILIDEMGLNSKNIKFITMGNIKSIPIGSSIVKLIPSVISDDREVVDSIEYRLLELEGGVGK